MTYDELKTKIRDYTEVSSTVLTDIIVNGIIEDAEFRILRDVDSDNNRRYATAALASGTRFIQTPDNTLVIRSAQIVDSDGVGVNNRIFYSGEIQVLCQNLTLPSLLGFQNIIAGGTKNTFFCCLRAQLHNSIKLCLERRRIIGYKYNYIH